MLDFLKVLKLLKSLIMPKTIFKKMCVLFSVVTIVSCSSFIDKHSDRMGKTSDIKIQDMKKLDRNGMLVAQATIKNNGNSKPVQYRFKWLGDKGQQVWTDESWKPLTVSEGRTTTIEGIAPTMDATDFKLELDSY
jgi:uncharacterized protein YcfL